MMDKHDAVLWAQHGAHMILSNHGNEVAIDTANYIECSFILAAARIALQDPDLSARIANMMEAPRPTDSDWKRDVALSSHVTYRVNSDGGIVPSKPAEQQ